MPMTSRTAIETSRTAIEEGRRPRNADTCAPRASGWCRARMLAGGMLALALAAPAHAVEADISFKGETSRNLTHNEADGNKTFTVVLRYSAAPPQGASINYTIALTGATSYTRGLHNQFLLPTPSLMAQGSSTFQNPTMTEYTIEILDDDQDEPDGTLTITLTVGGTGHSVKANEGILTIALTDNDVQAPVVTIAPLLDAVDEAADAMASFTVTSDIDAPTGGLAVTVHLYETGMKLGDLTSITGDPNANPAIAGQAACRDAANPCTAIVSIPATMREGTLSLPIEDNDAPEPNSIVVATVQDIHGYDPGDPAEARLQIIEDDFTQVAVAAVQTAALVEGTDRSLSINVTLTPAPAQPGPVDLTFEPSGAVGILPASRRTAFQARYIPGRPVPIAIEDDALHELGGALTLTLTAATALPPPRAPGDAGASLDSFYRVATTGNEVTVNWTDDDPEPFLVVDNVTAREGEDLVFTVRSVDASGNPVSNGLVRPAVTNDAGVVTSDPADGIVIWCAVADGTATGGTSSTSGLPFPFPGNQISPDDPPAVTPPAALPTTPFDFFNTGLSACLSLSAPTASDDPTMSDRMDGSQYFPAVIAPGATSVQVRIKTNDDNAVEANETMTLTLTAANGAGFEGSATSVSATGTIRDNDTADPVLRITPMVSALESENLVFTISLWTASGESGEPTTSGQDVTFTFGHTTAGTATGGGAGAGDFTTGTPVQVTLDAGSHSRTVRVFVRDDSAMEEDEMVVVELSSVTGATFEGGASTLRATGTILDNDTPRFSVADASASEDAERISFRVTLRPPSSVATSVRYAPASAAGDTATANTDYEVGAVQTLNFMPGETEGSAVVRTTDDMDIEGDETFTLRLSDPGSGTRLHRAEATGTIEDDERPVATVADASAAEGEDMRFAVRLSQAWDKVATIVWQVAFDSGPNAADANDLVAPTGGILSFSPGETEKMVTVHTVADGDAGESFRLRLTVRRGAMFANDAETLDAVGTIGVIPQASIEATAMAAEGDPLTFDVTLSEDAPAGGLTVGYAITADTAEADDYTAPDPLSVTIAAGQRTGTISIATMADTDFTEEMLTVMLSAGAGYTVGADDTGAGTITEEDAPTLSIANANARVGSPLSFAVTLSRAVPHATMVPFTVAGSGTVMAEAGTHYTAPTELTLTIPANERSANIVIMTLDATEDMQDETLTVTLTESPEHYTFAQAGDAMATGTITEGPVLEASIAATAGSVAEGGTLRYTVTLTAAAESDLSINYTVAGSGTNMAVENTDYTAPSGMLAIATGEMTGAIEIVTLADADFTEETLTVTLQNGTGYTVGSPDSAMGTITEQDAPTLSIADASVRGGGTLSFAVTLSRAAENATEVPFTVVGSGTNAAVAGTHYTAPTELTLTIPVNQTSANIEIMTIATEDMMDETLTVTLTERPGFYTIADGEATGTITEAPPPEATIVGVNDQASEGEDLTFEVRLSFEAESDLSIRYSVAGSGTNRADASDYSDPSRGMLAIAAGARSGTITLETLEDTDDNEESETLTVTLTERNISGYTVGTPASAEGTITQGLTPMQMEQVQQATLPHVGTSVTSATASVLQGRVASVLDGGALGGGLGAPAGTGAPAGGGGAGSGSGSAPAGADNFLSGAADAALRMLRARAEGRNALDFTLPLAGGAGGQRPALTFWGRGFYRDLDVDDAVSFDGDVTGGAIGMDVRRGNTVLGIGISESDADMDFDDGRTQGRHETSLTGVHPYIGWQASPRVQMWGALGIASGDVEITTGTTTTKTDVDMESISLGGSGVLSVRGDAARGGMLRYAFVADGTYTQIEEDDGMETEADSGWVRAGVERASERLLADGGAFGTTLGLLFRQDYGDALSGAGLELEGGVAMSSPRSGLHLDLKARVLLAHSDGIDDWGVSGGVTWRQAAGGRGLAVSFHPRIGAAPTTRSELWERGAAQDATATAADLYGLKLQYGVATADGGMLDLFARSDFAGAQRTFGFGADLNLADSWVTGYETLLRDAGADADADHRVYLRYESRF